MTTMHAVSVIYPGPCYYIHTTVHVQEFTVVLQVSYINSKLSSYGTHTRDFPNTLNATSGWGATPDQAHNNVVSIYVFIL